MRTCVHVCPWKSAEQVGGDFLLVHGGWVTSSNSGCQGLVASYYTYWNIMVVQHFFLNEVTYLSPALPELSLLSVHLSPETTWAVLTQCPPVPRYYLSWFLLTVANVKTAWQFSENRHRAIRLLSTNSLWRTGLLGCGHEESLGFTFFLGMTSCSLTPATRLT